MAVGIDWSEGFRLPPLLDGILGSLGQACDISASDTGSVRDPRAKSEMKDIVVNELFYSLLQAEGQDPRNKPHVRRLPHLQVHGTSAVHHLEVSFPGHPPR